MEILRIEPGLAADVDLFGSYECLLSGVDCPRCTQWGGGFRYPTIACADVAALGGIVSQFLRSGSRDGRRKPPAPMTVADYQSVKAQLEPMLGPNRPVMPGSSFGSATGELRGPVHDFSWNLWQIFVKQSVFDQIRAAGFPITGAYAELTYKTFRGRRWLSHDGPGEPLIELEIPPAAKLVSKCYKRCDICGRHELGRKYIVDQAIFDPSIPIQCLLETPAYLVVTEAFGEFIRENLFSGVKLSRQKTA